LIMLLVFTEIIIACLLVGMIVQYPPSKKISIEWESDTSYFYCSSCILFSVYCDHYYN